MSQHTQESLEDVYLESRACGLSPCIVYVWQGVSGGGTNGAAALFDEQRHAGDPASGKGEIILNSSYNPGWTKWMYPNAGSNFAPVDGANGGVQALIDLKVRLARFSSLPTEASLATVVCRVPPRARCALPSS